MALLEFENNTSPYLSAENLNNNFGYTVPLGGIVQYAGATAPNGWLICDGSEVSRITYADLFAIIGTTYGSGDESTTFNLPNLKGKVPVGYDSSQTEFDSLGETGGEKSHQLSYDELPSEVVTGYCANDKKNWATGEWTDYTTSTYPTNIVSNSGQGTGNQPHNILQPYIVLNYIIKY